MRATPQPHLNADDLDALLLGEPSPVVRTHLEACGQCFEMVRRDREVIGALQAVPLLAPRPGFPDRVMARVTVVQPISLASLAQYPRRLFSSRRALAAAATWTVVVGGAMVASVLWSLSNRPLLTQWGDQVVSQGSQMLWMGIRGLAANLAEQPWYEQARAIVTSPGRLAGLLAGLTVAYASGVLALRHLVAIPSRQVHDARA